MSADGLRGLVAQLSRDLRDWLARPSQRILDEAFAQPVELLHEGDNGIVVAYHPIAREIGMSMLRRGGNAFDAFVATAAAENVLAEGASSLAGALGVLVYRAADETVTYLDADFNTPLDPAAAWRPGDPPGKSVLVPAMPAGLVALASSHARLGLADLLEPAILLADEGFPVVPLMAQSISERASILRRNAYGLGTHFANGQPLKRGDWLRLPELAGFLRGLSQWGLAHVYGGEFCQRFLERVRREGGALGRDDLANYRVEWTTPWAMRYRDHVIYASSGPSYGGLWTLLALKAREEQGPGATDDLEQMMHIAHGVWGEEILFNLAPARQEAEVKRRLGEQGQAQLSSGPKASGSHSYHIITRDREGNIASGTITAQSEQWGDGLFVDGLALPTAGRIPWNTEPGQRRLSPLSMHLALREGQPRLSVGTISNSAVEAAFQILVNLVDKNLPLEEALSAPRFGTFPPRKEEGWVVPDLRRNWIDPRIPAATVKRLRSAGLGLQRSGTVDTGLGAALVIDEAGAVGATVPLPYVRLPFSS
jgi:gamma-glutamyltranspeptidase/glutathione hydrolase